MIKFTDDFSDLTVADLLVKKTMQTKLVRIRLGVLYGMLGLALVPVLYLWIRFAVFSKWYLVYFVYLILMGTGCRRFLEKGLKRTIRKWAAEKEWETEYTVTEEGIAGHREYQDFQVPWSSFIHWGTHGRMLYLENIQHEFIICHARQLSVEDYADFKALAAAHIGAQDKEGQR